MITVGKLLEIKHICSVSLTLNKCEPSLNRKARRILAALCESASISAAARQTGASKVTVLKLLADIGGVCLNYQRETLVNLPCKRLQCDEVWSFIGAKERNVAPADKGQGRRDAWTWTAICADTKLVPCWHIGSRR